MNIAVILGAAKEPMELRLEEALRRDYDQIVVSGTPEEMANFDLPGYESYSTWGNYVAVCNNSQPKDELTFMGHESHTHRMRVYREYFSDRDITNIVLPDPNLRTRYRAFDVISAAVHRLALQCIPETMKSQARDRNSCLNRYVIPFKNRIMN